MILPDIDAQTQIYGVMGWPIGHTASPAMHNAAYAALGMNARYLVFAVAPGLEGDAVRGLRALGARGVNVTVPHKQAVIPHLDELRGAAAALGAVNVIAREGNRLIGYNTDAAGFLRALEEADMAPAGAEALMLGAGGAARAVLYALRLGGASAVHIANRTREKADALAAAFSTPECTVKPAPQEQDAFCAVARRVKIIVNTTSLGMKAGDPLPMPPELIEPRHSVVDIVYNPWETPLLEAARRAGARSSNGYGMLLHQAAEAFRIWTGREAPLEPMRAAGERFIRGE